MGKRKERSDSGTLRPPSAKHGKSRVELRELAYLQTLVSRGKARDRRLRPLLVKAAKGDHEATGMLYFMFVRFVESNDYLRLLEHWRVLEFVAPRIERLLFQGGDPLKALGLSKKRGREKSLFPDYKVFTAAVELKQLIQNGKRPTAAVKDALLHKHGVSTVRQIERAYTRYFRTEGETR